MRCSCRSGRPFDRCHGDPANEFAREQALAEARQVALLFPSVRLRDRHADERADDVAAMLGEEEIPNDGLLEQVVSAAGAAAGRRAIEGWTSVYPDRWASLCHTAADVRAAERELLKGAAAAAIYERLPTPHERLVELELVDLSPGATLAFVLAPQFVWSYDEARVAAVAGPDEIDELAGALGRIEHVERIRALAELAGRELPFAGFPRSSKALAEAVASIGELSFARSVTALCLLAYVQELALSYSTSQN